jgi:hypothetical protein
MVVAGGDLRRARWGCCEVRRAGKGLLVSVSHPDPPVSELRQDLDGLPGLDEHVEPGRLPLVPIATVPALDPAVVGYSRWIGTQ